MCFWFSHVKNRSKRSRSNGKMMLLSLFIFGCLLNMVPLPAQSTTLTNYEVTLVGPLNTDKHHPAQKAYYIDYFGFLLEEVDQWLKEVNRELKNIKRRNRKRIKKQKPIKLKDYPKWKLNNELTRSLSADQVIIEDYIQKWKDYNIATPDSVMRSFQNAYDPDLCFDLITSEIVLSKEEYLIENDEVENGYFVWNEFIQKSSYNCPTEYRDNGKTCIKSREIESQSQLPPTFLISNLLTDLPVHLDGWKIITCPTE
jgi:hypothetical protein